MLFHYGAANYCSKPSVPKGRCEGKGAAVIIRHDARLVVLEDILGGPFMKHSFSSIGLLETSHELDDMSWECKHILESLDQNF